MLFLGSIVALLVVGISIYIGLNALEDPKAKLIAQQKWAQNDLLMQTLTRYAEVYQKLERQSDKDVLAFKYVDRLTNDLFLYPPKPGGDKLKVILPDQMDASIYVLSEIKLTSDLGLFNAYQYSVNRYKGTYKPAPIYSPDTNRLMNYIMTGEEGEEKAGISQ